MANEKYKYNLRLNEKGKPEQAESEGPGQRLFNYIDLYYMFT
jgi:hypothetical protein